ncbi:MAG: ATP-binding protein [Mycobacteriales bacterium]
MGGALGELGERLHQLRELHGLSLRVLARRLGLAGHGNLLDYERGRRLPPEDLVERYERVLGVAAGELVGLRERALAERAGRRVREQHPMPPADPEPDPEPDPDPGLDPEPGPVAQLPAGVADFVGRAGELEWLGELVAGWRGHEVPAPLVVAVSGAPGVGKTALAVHFALRMAAEFPDAQLYYDLRGVEAAPADPGAVLAAFLTGLGYRPDRLPAGTAERAALYRSVLSTRRAVVVLDNAGDEAQVRPLLPGAGTCLVVVTSRNRLAGLAASRWLPLDVPDEAVALALLRGIVPAERISADPAAAREVVRLCGRLPLAIRMVGNQVAALGWSVRYAADRLADECGRLDRLSAGDLRAGAAFQMSYDLLAPPVRTAFRRLAPLPGADFGAEVVAASTGTRVEEAEANLAALAQASLVEPAVTAGRYRVHDLLRLYARRRLIAEDGGATGAERAEQRVAVWLLAAAGLVARGLRPPGAVPIQQEPAAELRAALDRTGPLPAALDGGAGPATAWLDREWTGLAGLARQVAGTDAALLLPAVMEDLVWYLDLRCRWQEWRDLAEAGLAAARRAGDEVAAAAMLNWLGRANAGLGEYTVALDCHRQALGLDATAGRPALLSAALDGAGMALWGLGRFEEAIDHHRRDAEVSRRSGDRWSEATAYNHLGHALRHQGRPAEACGWFRRALAMFRAAGNDRSAAMALLNLGLATSALSRYEESLALHGQALAEFESGTDDWAQGVALAGMADARQGQGRYEEAVAGYQAVLERFRRAGDDLRYLATDQALREARARTEVAATDPSAGT